MVQSPPCSFIRPYSNPAGVQPPGAIRPSRAWSVASDQMLRYGVFEGTTSLTFTPDAFRQLLIAFPDSVGSEVEPTTIRSISANVP